MCVVFVWHVCCVCGVQCMCVECVCGMYDAYVVFVCMLCVCGMCLVCVVCNAYDVVCIVCVCVLCVVWCVYISRNAPPVWNSTCAQHNTTAVSNSTLPILCQPLPISSSYHTQAPGRHRSSLLRNKPVIPRAVRRNARYQAYTRLNSVIIVEEYYLMLTKSLKVHSREL